MADLLSDTARFIRREGLLRPEAPVRVAVSGGVDSMVLLHVLRALGHPCEVAHVDHGLRGAESDDDLAFVRHQCERGDLIFRSIRVDVKEHAAARGLSAQMAARDLRYMWLNGLSSQDDLPIALAHHADDAVETLLLGLLRGTGVQGWGSIRPSAGRCVRPLLHASRTDILEYAAVHAVPYREDSSNIDHKYLRNRVRHELLPLIESLRPGALRSMARSLEQLRELVDVGDRTVKPLSERFLPDPNGTARIPFHGIEGPAMRLVLHGLLRPRGFHPDTIHRVREAILERATGSLFTAGEWQVGLDREALLLGPAHTEYPAYVIDPDTTVGPAGPFRWSITNDPAPLRAVGASEALLDADILSFPIELRPWRTGDRIRPIGLGGSKLVSDILIDGKVPMMAKPGVYVLVSAGTVVWVCGHRAAEGFQVTTATRSVLHIMPSEPGIDRSNSAQRIDPSG